MNNYSKSSKDKLKTCHPKIQEIMNKVIEGFDNTITEGIRDKETQDKYFESGASTVKWPNSEHNVENSEDLSRAIDSIPYPIDYRYEKALLNAIEDGNLEEVMDIIHNIERWFMYIGFIKGVAFEKGIEVVSGADWDSDNQMSDQRFDDLPHLQLGKDEE